MDGVYILDIDVISGWHGCLPHHNFGGTLPVWPCRLGGWGLVGGWIGGYGLAIVGGGLWVDRWVIVG